MKKIIFFGFIFFVVSNLYSQKYTLSGFIRDSVSHENLVGVVIVEKKLNISTSCNAYGFYSLKLPAGENVLTVFISGYRTKDIIINLGQDTVLDIEMSPVSIELQQIVVKGQSRKMNTYTLPMQKISKIPVVAGETDVIKTLQQTTGITSGAEGSASLNVRGSSPDQNLYLLDGIPVYNVNHLFGFFSVFNTDALKSVKLIKGGIPAQYHGRTSSVVDIYMKEGDMRQVHGDFTIGLISSKFMLEGPLKKDKSSFIITGRRTYIDLLFRPFSEKIADNTVSGYYFYDFNAKWNYKFSDKNRIFFSFYTGHDKGYIKDKNKGLDDFDYITGDSLISRQFDQQIYWGNITGALRWLSIISRKISMNNTVFYTHYNYNSDTYFEQIKLTQESDTIKKQYNLAKGSGIEELGYKSNLDFFISDIDKLKLGLTFSKKNFFPSFHSEQYFNNFTTDTIIKDLQNSSDAISAYEFSVYAQNNFNYKFFHTFLGLNFNSFAVDSSVYKYIEPRLNIIFNISDKINFQTSYTLTHQYLHLLTNSGFGMPTDLWLPSTKKLKPISATIYDAGFDFNLNQNFSFGISVFYKDMNNLIKYKQGADFLDLKIDWQYKVTLGKGRAYGIEFFIQKSISNFTAQLNYTYSRSFRTFEEINSGKEFPYKYDRPHSLNVLLEYNFRKISITANWVFMSGQNLTMGDGYFMVDEIGYHNENFIYNYISDYNNFRYPFYHRLDIGFNYKHVRRKTTRIWNVGVYNVYNRLNPFYFTGSDKPNTITGVCLAPIMPFFSYSIKF